MLRRVFVRQFAAVALLATVCGIARADQGWTQPQNAHNNPVYGLPAPSGANAATEPLLYGGHLTLSLPCNATGGTSVLTDCPVDAPFVFGGSGGNHLQLSIDSTLRVNAGALGVASASVYADGISTGSVQLASVAAASLQDGTIAWVKSVGDFFKLVPSALTTTATTVVAASGKAGYRWIRLGISNPNWAARTSWFVDPANSSAAASDENDGASSGAPLATMAEMGRRLTNAFLASSSTITINLISNGPNTDPLVLNNVSTAFGPTIKVVGQVTTIASGINITAANNPTSAGVADHFEITTGSSASYSTWISNHYLLERTNGTTAFFWPYSDRGSGRLQVSLPLNGSTVQTISPGDTLSVLSLPTIAGVLAVNSDPKLFVTTQEVSVIGWSLAGGQIFEHAMETALNFDRVLFAPASGKIIGLNSNTVDGYIGLQNICAVLATSPGMAITGPGVRNSGGLIVGSGSQILEVAQSLGWLAGGALSATMTLGGVELIIDHMSIVQKLDLMVYDTSAGVLSDLGANVSIDAIGGERNTGSIVGTQRQGVVYPVSGSGFSTWAGTATSSSTPYSVNGTVYTQAQLGIDTNHLMTDGGGILGNGGWGGDLAGLGANPNVVGLKESGGTDLPIGSIPNGSHLQRSGTSIIGDSTVYAAAATTVTGTAPVAIAGDHAAHDLSANRTWSLDTNGVTGSLFRQSGANSLVGNPTGSTSNVTDIGLVAPLFFSGGNLILDYDGSSLILSGGTVLERAALTGDISCAAGNNSCSISANAVTNSGFRQSAALSVVGRSANSTGNVADISATAASDCAYRESGSTLGCGQLATNAYTNNSVTLAKLAQIGGGTILGNSGGTTGNVAANSVLAPLQLTTGNLGLLRDTSVFSVNGSNQLTLTVNGVTNSFLAQMATNTIKGNNTGGTANALDLTATQVTAMLNQFTTSLQGLVPGSGGGTTNFLRADGTWAAPAGAGVSSLGATVPFAVSASTGAVIGSVLYDNSSIDLNGSNQLEVANNGVTYAKIQHASASTFLGNPTVSTANISEIGIGSGLAFTLGASSPPTTNLVAWYKADAGVHLSGSNVTQWDDQSGNGWTLTTHGGNDLPTFHTSVVNGLPGLLFDTTNGNAQLANTGTVFAHNSARYVVAILKPTTPTVGSQTGGFTDGGPFAVINNPANFFYPTWGDFGGTVYVSGAVTSSASIVAGTPYEIEWGSTGGSGTFTVFENGTGLTLSSSASQTDNTPDGLFVGYDNGTGNGSFSGYEVELLFYSAAPSGPDLAQLRGYLQLRSAITIAGAGSGSNSLVLQGALVDGSTSTTPQNLGLLTTGLPWMTVTGGQNVFSTATASNVASALGGWPAATELLVSNGTSSTPTGSVNLEYVSGALTIGSGNGGLRAIALNEASTDQAIGKSSGNLFTGTDDSHGFGLFTNSTVRQWIDASGDFAYGRGQVYVGSSSPQTQTFGGAAIDWNLFPPSQPSSGVPDSMFQIENSTLTLTGTTHVTSGTVGAAYFKSPTITDSSAVTVDSPFTVAIAGPPFAGGSVTFGTGFLLPRSFWVQSGMTELDGPVAINGPAVGTNQNLVVGISTESARDSSSFFLGGSTSTSAGDYFHIFLSPTTLPSSSSFSRLVSQTIEQESYTSPGTSSISLSGDLDTLRIVGPPIVTNPTGFTFSGGGGALYGISVDSGAIKIGGQATAVDGTTFVNGPRVFALPQNTSHSPAGGSPTMVVEVFIQGVGEKFLYLYDH